MNIEFVAALLVCLAVGFAGGLLFCSRRATKDARLIDFLQTNAVDLASMLKKAEEQVQQLLTSREGDEWKPIGWKSEQEN